MSTTRTSSVKRVALDHFEPEGVSDPTAQRKLRGHLEQIDYTAFAADKEVIAASIGAVGANDFQRVAVAAAHARARWVSQALVMTEPSHALSAEQVSKLAQLRSAYDELLEAYEAMRRMVERGYLPYRAAEPR